MELGTAKKLGFGLMRLPMIEVNGSEEVDTKLVNKMVDYFIEQGFTYFDTAWMYCGFKSETATKTCLVDRYPRDKFTLATKLHGGFFETEEGMDEIFNKQLENCGVDYFDYYLLHDVGEDHYKKYTRLHSFEWLVNKKKEGKAKHIGFSYHDGADLLDRILSEHPEIEFVQLQLNYIDWDSEGIQSGRCYEVAKKHGVPVIVMEPVKGGTLSNVTPDIEKLFKDYDADASVASYAIRFAASHDNVKMVLSGMGNMEMMVDNTSYMKDFKPLNEDEKAIIDKVVEIMNGRNAIPCTGCSYCVDGCPMSIAIPKYFALLNAERQEYEGKGFTPQGGYYNRLTSKYGKASECIACGQCEGICPQHLPIVNLLQDVARQFER